MNLSQNYINRARLLLLTSTRYLEGRLCRPRRANGTYPALNADPYASPSPFSKRGWRIGECRAANTNMPVPT